MDSITIILLLDVILLTVLVCLLSYHIRQNKHDRKKTEQIEQELEAEHEKTNKFHVSIEEIRSMTKN
jgi:cell division protein FtsL